MNVRILRMCERGPVGNLRLVKGMGQLQPVIFGYERGAPTLRIEGISDRHGKSMPCWHVLPLPRYKAEAKRLFAEMEAHLAAGMQGPASKAWSDYQASKEGEA